MILLSLAAVFYAIAFLVSVWIGNFATTFYFRIPRGIPLNGRTNPPMCSNCKTRLRYPDYGPLYYYLFKSKSCKKCGAKIPFEYTLIELIFAFVLVFHFAINGITEQTIIEAFLMAAILLILVINLKHKEIYEKTLWILVVPSLLRAFYIYQSHPEQLLYQLTFSMFIGFVLSFIIIRYNHYSYARLFYVSSLAFAPADVVVIGSAAIVVSLFGIFLIKTTKYKNIMNTTNILICLYLFRILLFNRVVL